MFRFVLQYTNTQQKEAPARRCASLVNPTCFVLSIVIDAGIVIYNVRKAQGNGRSNFKIVSCVVAGVIYGSRNTFVVYDIVRRSRRKYYEG